MISAFLARFARGPILLDAALGTRLIAAGLDLATDDPCLWVVDRPEVVFDLHARDVATGAAAVFTDTFGANRAWLARLGRADEVVAINRRAVALARQAVGPDRFVVGSIGPTAVEDPATLLEQVDALLNAGVDALALETCRFDQAISALGHSLGHRPILVGLYAWPEPTLPHARRLLDAGASVVGVNCSGDLALIHRLIDEWAAAAIPCWLKPSTGWPGPGTVTPADFAEIASRLARFNTGALGGCCGTSEVHLRVIRDEWRRLAILRGNMLGKPSPGS